MKQTLLITALFLFCLSCNNRTGEATAHANAEPLAQKITTDPIVGTWRMVSFSYNSEFSAGELLGKISAVGKDIGDVRITFHPDGTSTNNGQKFIVEFTTTIGGHSTTKNIPTKPDFSEGTWRREGNMLVVFNPKNPVDIGEQKIPIVELTDTTLHLNGELPSISPMPGQGSIILDVRYERVSE